MSSWGLAKLGRTLRRPFVLIGTTYNETARKSPMWTGVITTLVKTSAADAFAQKLIENRDQMDWKRHGMFCGFGFAYLGCWQFYLYNTLFARWCKPITAVVGHLGSAPVKTFIDQALHHPFVYFPSFYLLKGIVEGRTVESSAARYQRDLWENCKALWTIWVPAQLVNFAVVPHHLRIPFVALVSFAWTVVISVMRGGLEKHEQPALGPRGENRVAPMESVDIGHIAGTIAFPAAGAVMDAAVDAAAASEELPETPVKLASAVQLDETPLHIGDGKLTEAAMQASLAQASRG